jgi:hypothetical protein
VRIRVDDDRFGELGEDCEEGCVGQYTEWSCTQSHEAVDSKVVRVTCEGSPSCTTAVLGPKEVSVTSHDVGTVTVRVLMHDVDNDEDMESMPLEMRFLPAEEVTVDHGGSKVPGAD